MKVRKGIPPLKRVALYEGNEPHPSTVTSTVSMAEYLDVCQQVGDMELEFIKSENALDEVTHIATHLTLLVEDIYVLIDVINDKNQHMLVISEAASDLFNNLSRMKDNLFRLVTPIRECGLADKLRARYTEHAAKVAAEKSDD